MTNSFFEFVFLYKKGFESGIGRLVLESSKKWLSFSTMKAELERLGVENYTILKCERM